MNLKNKRGFTLLELLVAAVIIGTLAVFATQSFRQSSSDIRVQNALAKAKVVAMAARIFKDDYGDLASFTSGNLENPSYDSSVSGACNTTQTVTLQTLVNCGYLEHRQYLDNDFEYNFNTSCSAGVCVCMRKANTGSRVIAEATAESCTDGETVFTPTGKVGF